MKRTALLLCVLAFFAPLSITAQCNHDMGDPINEDNTTYSAGNLPLGAPIYSNTMVLSQLGFVGTYMKVDKVVSGRTYQINSATTTDYFTIRQGATVITHGLSGLSFTATNSNPIQIHLSENAACAATSFSTRRITMSCTTCSAAPAAPPAGNNTCANAITTTVAANYNPSSPSFTANTTNGATEITGLCGETSTTKDDIWYKFNKATSGVMYIRHDNMIPTTMLIGNSVSKFMGVALYSGSTCPTANASADFGCQSSNVSSSQITTLSLPAGDYYLRVFSSQVLSNAQTNVWLYYSPSVVPVEMQSFTAKTKGNTNTLTWTTATEKDINHFRVERSNTGTDNWQSIAQVKAAGNSTTTQTYNLTDETPLSISYYRIVSVENTGKTETSKVVNVAQKVNQVKIVSLSPNPATTQLVVSSVMPKTGTTVVTLTDILGRVVRTENRDNTEGGNLIELNTQNLPNGSYYLTLTDGQSRETRRFVKH